MEWTDEGIVLGVRRHGESSAIVELLTRDHGRHLGLVRGGAVKRMRPLLQPGNSVTAVWRARLDEHLGYYAHRGDAAARGDRCWRRRMRSMACTHLASLVRLLPERDPHEDIYEMLDARSTISTMSAAPRLHLIRFELAMLAELGFGLDLENCAATGDDHGSDLRLAEIRRRGVAAGRRALSRPAAAAAAVSARRRGRRERLVDQDLQDGFRADRPVPAPPRAGAARAGPFRCARRVHQRGDRHRARVGRLRS